MTTTLGPSLSPCPFLPCVLIPVYNHPAQIARIVDTLLAQGLPVLLVDDGSDAPTRDLLVAIQANHPQTVTLERLPRNVGKGGAVSHGLRRAHALGFTHALQVDADGQHDLCDVSAFLEDARQHPSAVICGTPRYDASVPKGRLYGRYITHFWVWIETLSFDIADSMCGFRVYPLSATTALLARHRPPSRMAFDTDILVRLYWRGVPIQSRRTRVVYPENGVSHFQMLRDNVGISWMHTRLVCAMIPRAPGLLWRKCRRNILRDILRNAHRRRRPGVVAAPRARRLAGHAPVGTGLPVLRSAHGARLPDSRGGLFRAEGHTSVRGLARLSAAAPERSPRTRAAGAHAMAHVPASSGVCQRGTG